MSEKLVKISTVIDSVEAERIYKTATGEDSLPPTEGDANTFIKEFVVDGKAALLIQQVGFDRPWVEGENDGDGPSVVIADGENIENTEEGFKVLNDYVDTFLFHENKCKIKKIIDLRGNSGGADAAK